MSGALRGRSVPAGVVIGEQPSRVERITFGAATLDQALDGGLVRSAQHEIFPAAATDITAATGFAVAVASRASGPRPLLVVWQDFFDIETGRLNASGLRELGLDPAHLVLVRAADATAALRAAEQGARCPALGAVFLAVWGTPSVLNLTASRRLTLASAGSGVPVFLLRAAASPAPSAAATRWLVAAAPSRALAANAPGFPAFQARLIRHRGGVPAGTWHVEWNRDRTCFRDLDLRGAETLPRTVVSVPADRSTAALGRPGYWRKAG